MKKSLAAMAMLALGAASMASAAQAEGPIEAQISRIEQAPASERWREMNAFKERLAAMQPDRREQIIDTLRERFMPETAAAQAMAMPHMERVIDQHQATQMFHMENTERMGQRQGVDQYIHNHPDLLPGHGGNLFAPQQPGVPGSQAGSSASSVPGVPGAGQPAPSAPTAQNDHARQPQPILPFGHRN